MYSYIGCSLLEGIRSNCSLKYRVCTATEIPLLRTMPWYSAVPHTGISLLVIRPGVSVFRTPNRSSDQGMMLLTATVEDLADRTGGQDAALTEEGCQVATQGHNDAHHQVGDGRPGTTLGVNVRSYNAYNQNDYIHMHVCS